MNSQMHFLKCSSTVVLLNVKGYFVSSSSGSNNLLISARAEQADLSEFNSFVQCVTSVASILTSGRTVLLIALPGAVRSQFV